ncbi:ABC transporter permease [Nocardioides panacisoli]|uniref:ABC transporter permease n=1 Tax=Nocardioides panacisoli TaxID=627624 RepID=A0ABP7ITT8_9ACTN
MTAHLAEPIAADARAASRRRPALGVLRWEVRKLVAQWRTRSVLLAGAIAPVVVVFVMRGQSRPPKDSLFGRYALDNGFALALLILGFASQWVLPLLTAIVAGDIFASEDQQGTWKTVLTRSASRSRLFGAKVVAALGFAVLTLAVVAVSTTAASVLVVGHQPLTGLTGQVIPSSAALRLVSESWLSMLPATLGFTCLAILLSVWSRNAAVGIAAPVVLGMVMQMVGSLGGVEAIRPFLLTTPYEAWHGLMTAPQFIGPMKEGLLTCGLWCVATLAAAFVLLRRRDITGG